VNLIAFNLLVNNKLITQFIIAFTFVNMSKITAIYQFTHFLIFSFGWLRKRIAVQGGSPMMKTIR